MRQLILLSLIPLSIFAQSIELSALNYGGDWQARDAKFLADHQAALNNHVKGGVDLGPILYHYTYAANDSAISLITSEDSLKVVERYFNLTKEGVQECPVELTWATISKHSPAVVKKAVYDTWHGGPWDKKIESLSATDARGIILGKAYLKLVDEVQKKDKKLKRGEAWLKVKTEVEKAKRQRKPRKEIPNF